MRRRGLNGKKILGTDKTFTQENGRVKIILDNDVDQETMKLSEEVNKISERLKKMDKSEVRIDSLIETIDYLDGYGNVFLVRLPVNKEILKIENEYWNGFDAKMESISTLKQIPYINLTDFSNFKTHDGHHLKYADGDLVTNKIADLILGNK